MSSLYEVISTLLLVPGFMKLNPKWQSKWTYRKSHKHFVVINQWIWGFQLSRQPLSDNLTSTFCRAWIPAISAVWGEAISAVIGSPANRSHQVSLSCFGWFSETNRLCFAKSDGTASSCKRPEIHRSHTISHNYAIIWSYSPKNRSTRHSLHHYPSLSIILHHCPPWIKASRKFALAGAESSHCIWWQLTSGLLLHVLSLQPVAPASPETPHMSGTLKYVRSGRICRMW